MPQSLIAQLTQVDRRTRALQCTAVLTLVLVVGVVIGVVTPGYPADIEQGKTWARHLARNGLRDAYRTDIDGAPIVIYVFGAVGWLYQTMFDPAWNERAAQGSQALTLMLKAPMIAAHVAITGVLFALSASANAGSKYWPVAVALAYGLNPATLYDAAHFGQTDPLVGLVVVTCLAACYRRSGLLLGIGAAGLLIGKPQGWILIPIIALAALSRLDLKRVSTAAITAIVTLSVLVSPWTFTGRANHVWRYLDNLSGHDISNRVISADAHNVWWIPTLLNGDWIEDSIPFVGPLSYRMVAGGLALMWLAFCLLGLRRGAPGGFSFAAAAASFGFFMLMTRAHENHSYLALTLLVCALATHADRRLWVIFGLVSVGLFANLVLRDPLVMGAFTSVPDPGQDPPMLIVALQVVNIAVFGIALALMGRFLGSRASHPDRSPDEIERSQQPRPAHAPANAEGQLVDLPSS